MNDRIKILFAAAALTVTTACAPVNRGPEPNAVLVTNPDGSVRVVRQTVEPLYCGYRVDQRGQISGNSGNLGNGQISSGCVNEFERQTRQTERPSAIQTELERLQANVARDLANETRRVVRQEIQGLFR